jgi:hypothetical protein
MDRLPRKRKKYGDSASKPNPFFISANPFKTHHKQLKPEGKPFGSAVVTGRTRSHWK